MYIPRIRPLHLACLSLPLLLAGCGNLTGNDSIPAAPHAAGVAAAVSAHAVQAPAWGRLADTDPGLGEVYEVFVITWDDDELKDKRQLLARIEADGTFRLLNPDAAVATLDGASSMSEDVENCGPGTPAIKGGEEKVSLLLLEARRATDGRKYLLQANTLRADADWARDPEVPYQPGQGELRLYQSSGDVRVRGTCGVIVTEYGASSETRYDLDIRRGLNLVLDRHDRRYGYDSDADNASEQGDEYTRLSVPAFPEDVRWHLYEPHALFDSADIIWGQLEGDGLEATALRIHASQPLEGDQSGPDVPLGETGPDGYFHFANTVLPPAMLDDASPVATFFCENAEIDNPDARMIEFSLGATDTEGGRWVMAGAARREFASLRAGHGNGRFEQGDQQLRVYYLSERVEIRDDCEGDRVSFHFSPGWNLVRATVMEVDGRDHEDGPWPSRWEQENLPEVPPNMRWYLFPDTRTAHDG